MNIALIANDNKKELMVDLCIAYKTFCRSTPCFPRNYRIVHFQREQGCRCTVFRRE